MCTVGARVETGEYGIEQAVVDVARRASHAQGPVSALLLVQLEQLVDQTQRHTHVHALQHNHEEGH